MPIPRIAAPWRLPVATDRPGLVEVLHFTDAACPWAYNFEPALRAVEARYGDQITDPHRDDRPDGEPHDDYVARGYTAVGTSLTRRRFRFRGMPMATGPRLAPLRHRPSLPPRQGRRAPGRGRRPRPCCGRCASPWFTTDLVMDSDEALRAVAESVDGLDAERALADAGHARGRGGLPARPRRDAQPRSASPVTLGRTAATDGPDRYTAPSIVLRAGGRQLVAPGFQPFEAVDVLDHEPRARTPSAFRLPSLAGPARRPTPAASRPPRSRACSPTRRLTRPGCRRRAHPPVRDGWRRRAGNGPRRALGARLAPRGGPIKPASRI